MSQLAQLPKPRLCSPARSNSKPNIRPIIKQSPSRGSSNSVGAATGISDFTARYYYLLPRAPVVVLESPYLADMLNYYAEDRYLLEAEICDFDINVESGIPFSGSVRVERKWKQMYYTLKEQEYYNRPDVYADNNRESEVRDITDNPALMTELVEEFNTHHSENNGINERQEQPPGEAVKNE